MALNAEEVLKLLAVVAAYEDRRAQPTRTDVVVWMKASEVAGWPSYVAAEEAVHRHCAHETWPIKPAHVTQGIAAAQAEHRRAQGGLPCSTPFAELERGPEPAPEMSDARKAAWEEIVRHLSVKKSMPSA